METSFDPARFQSPKVHVLVVVATFVFLYFIFNIYCCLPIIPTMFPLQIAWSSQNCVGRGLGEHWWLSSEVDAECRTEIIVVNEGFSQAGSEVQVRSV